VPRDRLRNVIFRSRSRATVFAIRRCIMKTDVDKLSREEMAKRHDEAIRRALSNTPKQDKGFASQSAKGLKGAAPNVPKSALKGRLFRHQGR
jgi:hypothetical protein